jgi:hypothetical protein
MSASRVIRVAAVQAAPAVLDRAASLDRLEEWTHYSRPDVFEFMVKASGEGEGGGSAPRPFP